MCTLIVLHRCVPGRPLVVAANRDEFFARPAEGPAIRSTGSGRILAPLDLEAGGSWVGLSEAGVFAGLTNLRPVASIGQIEKKRRSRGEVVMAALESRSAEEAAETLSRLEEGAYNPFQLCVADAKAASLLVYRETPKIFALEPGLHVVGNVEGNVEGNLEGSVEGSVEGNVDDERAGAVSDEPLGQACGATGEGNAFPGFEGIEGLIDTEEPRAQKLLRIRSRVEKLLTDPDRDLFEGLARICREHVEQGSPDELGLRPRSKSPFESTCVHVADRYGTRSSLLLELSEDVPTSRFWTTDGPPCRRPFENRSSLLRELGVRLSA